MPEILIAVKDTKKAIQHCLVHGIPFGNGKIHLDNGSMKLLGMFVEATFRFNMGFGFTLARDSESDCWDMARNIPIELKVSSGQNRPESKRREKALYVIFNVDLSLRKVSADIGIVNTDMYNAKGRIRMSEFLKTSERIT